MHFWRCAPGGVWGVLQSAANLLIPACRGQAIIYYRLALREQGTPCCGTRHPLRLLSQACVLPTTATRSAPCFRHRRRSHRSPQPHSLLTFLCGSKKVRPPAGTAPSTPYRSPKNVVGYRGRRPLYSKSNSSINYSYNPSRPKATARIAITIMV